MSWLNTLGLIAIIAYTAYGQSVATKNAIAIQAKADAHQKALDEARAEFAKRLDALAKELESLKPQQPVGPSIGPIERLEEIRGEKPK